MHQKKPLIERLFLLYHSFVHRYLAILLILLVPVRVFGAESIGLCMMQMSASHEESAAAMPDDCPMMAKGEANAPSGHQKHDGGGCESCQLCMPLAGADDIAVTHLSRPESVAPIATIAHFASAEVDGALRPPIS